VKTNRLINKIDRVMTFINSNYDSPLKSETIILRMAKVKALFAVILIG